MNYPPGADTEINAPWHDRFDLRDQEFSFETTIPSHDGDSMRRISVKGNYYESEGQKSVTAMKYSYIGAVPSQESEDVDYDVRDRIREHLGNVSFDH